MREARKWEDPRFVVCQQHTKGFGLSNGWKVLISSINPPRPKATKNFMNNWFISKFLIGSRQIHEYIILHSSFVEISAIKV